MDSFESSTVHLSLLSFFVFLFFVCVVGVVVFASFIVVADTFWRACDWHWCVAQPVAYLPVTLTASAEYRYCVFLPATALLLQYLAVWFIWTSDEGSTML